jgi:hypothetical protein
MRLASTLIDWRVLLWAIKHVYASDHLVDAGVASSGLDADFSFIKRRPMRTIASRQLDQQSGRTGLCLTFLACLR